MKNLESVKDQIARMQAEKKKQLLNSLILKNIKGGAKGSVGSTCPPPCCH